METATVGEGYQAVPDLRCDAQHYVSMWICTRTKGHIGDHIAHYTIARGVYGVKQRWLGHLIQEDPW